MIISVRSPRKSQGQTVVAVNMAAIIAKKKNKKVLLIDTNKLCRDLSGYLTTAPMPHGLDNFINAYKTNKLSSVGLKNCVTPTDYGIDIMNSNMQFTLEFDMVQELLVLASLEYEYIVIDLNGPLSDFIVDQSDMTFTVINNDRIAFETVKGKELMLAEKLIVNRYAEKMNGVKLTWKADKQIVAEAGFNEENVHRLNLDGNLINACNESRLLHYVMTAKRSKYLNELMKLVKEI